VGPSEEFGPFTLMTFNVEEYYHIHLQHKTEKKKNRVED